MAEGKITELVNDKQVRRLIVLELLQERVVGLGGDQVIDHVHGGCEKDLEIGVACREGDALSQEGLSRAGISDEDDVHVLPEKPQVQEGEDALLLLGSGVVVVEVELIDGDSIGQFGLSVSQFNGCLPAVLDFKFCQAREHGHRALVLLPCFVKDGIEVLSHGFEVEPGELLPEGIGFNHGNVSF